MSSRHFQCNILVALVGLLHIFETGEETPTEPDRCLPAAPARSAQRAKTDMMEMKTIFYIYNNNNNNNDCRHDGDENHLLHL